MDPHKRSEILFTKAKEQGLVGFNGDGAPTEAMVAEAIVDAGDYSAEVRAEKALCSPMKI